MNDGILESILRGLLNDLESRGKIYLSELYIDGFFPSAKKGALDLVKRSAARRLRSLQLPIATVFLPDYSLEVLRRMKPL